MAARRRSDRRLPPLGPTAVRGADEVLQIAHRGGNGGADDYRPEHLARIAAWGCHLVEIDVRVGAEGALVVHHDPQPPPTAPPAALVIRAARHAGLGAYLDIKDLTLTTADDLAALLAAEDMSTRTILASADPTLLRLCATTAPRVPRSVLFRSVSQDPVALARDADAAFVHPCWEDQPRPDKLLNEPWLAVVRAHGLGVITWHEERPQVLAHLLRLRVDGICTDDPALLAHLARTP
jgi:glycerophosphoryl diester phosphodiesterase